VTAGFSIFSQNILAEAAVLNQVTIVAPSSAHWSDYELLC